MAALAIDLTRRPAAVPLGVCVLAALVGGVVGLLPPLVFLIAPIGIAAAFMHRFEVVVWFAIPVLVFTPPLLLTSSASPAAPELTVQRLLLAMLLCLWLVAIVIRRVEPPRTVLVGPFLLVVGAFGLSVLLSIAPDVSAKALGSWVIESFVFFLMMLSLLSTRGRAVRMIRILMIGGIIVAALGLFESLAQINVLALVPEDLIPARLPRELVYRAQGVLIKPNVFYVNHIDLGAILAMTLPLALALRGAARSTWSKLLVFAAIALLGAALLATTSRGAWLASAVAAAIMLGWRRSLVAAVAGTAAFALVWLAALSFGTDVTAAFGLQETFGGTYSDFQGAITNRFAFIEAGLSAFLAHPLFGIGLNAYSQQPVVGYWRDSLGNYFLADVYLVGLALETGAVGVLAVVVLYLRVISLAFTGPAAGWRGDRTSEMNWRATAAAVAAALVVTLTSSGVLEKTYVGWMFWTLIACNVALRTSADAAVDGLASTT